MKIVLVQLADKARHVAVLEMLGKNGTSEFFILDNHKCVAVLAPSSNILMCWILKHSIQLANKFAGIAATNPRGWGYISAGHGFDAMGLLMIVRDVMLSI